ncbi:hypothetical protein AOE55_02165 [Candidatus Riesia pediculicola]|nr:hypothetical protein [Candidatus Riesia pediculicola]ARC53939.1 hypothetical protein AOE55_02165 [Candidatus Riesia pediculicola]ARC54559.1 hypothetical protein AOE56_02475 [Candidatus Riesia pediculicola]
MNNPMKKKNNLAKIIIIDIFKKENFSVFFLLILIIITLIETFKVNYEIKLLTIEKEEEIEKNFFIKSEKEILNLKKYLSIDQKIK